MHASAEQEDWGMTPRWKNLQSLVFRAMLAGRFINIGKASHVVMEKLINRTDEVA